jgi:hypothetical protein
VSRTDLIVDLLKRWIEMNTKWTTEYKISFFKEKSSYKLGVYKVVNTKIKFKLKKKRVLGRRSKIQRYFLFLVSFDRNDTILRRLNRE